MTSVNERQYQIPFCQVLVAEGETILYVSPHGPFEKGKDIIARTATGEIRAYQLKAGDIGLSEWRDIHGEIVNLVELAIELPGTAPIIEFVPYLVTNGELTDPVWEQVRVQNVTWQSRGINKSLHVIQKGELFAKFRSSHGAYLPRESDFRMFLQLVSHDGTAPAEKEKAARLLERVLPDEPQDETSLNVARAASSIVLLTSYITSSAVVAANHWCVFEYWVLTGAHVLYLAEKSNKAEDACQVSFELCESAAESALNALADECAQRSDLVQGFPLVEGHTYRPRITILLGLLSGLDLSLRVRRKTRSKAEFVHSFLTARLREAALWGESAVPYFYLAALEAEQHCRPHVAEGIAIQLVREISGANGASATGRGLPGPYYSPEEALRLNYGLDSLNSEQFRGFSYAVGALVDYLARRWRRQALAGLWFGVTRMSFVTLLPASFPDWFRWESSEGTLASSLPREPQSWEALRVHAETIPLDELPPTLVKRPAFALWFILVYPHRFTPAVAKLIEDAVWKST
ncbi:MAG: hypothetical protein LAO56_08405 [Acidobacteriia bacterium]|nr:hypothetical protein [Terriglobia bacterium]